MTTRLNQMLGVRKQVNNQAGRTFVEVARNAQKVQLMTGLNRTYSPKDDDGDLLPGEFQKVQFSVNDLNGTLMQSLERMYDVNATVDKANQTAAADIIWAGNTIPQVPVTTLMWLDKQLTELRAFITSLPVLDPAFDWEYDSNAGVWKTPATMTHRTVKTQKPIVLYPATDKHAAQTQLIVEDEIAGYWTAVRLSGAIPSDDQRAMLTRLEQLREAVTVAREKANETVVDDVSIGGTILEYVFAGT